jgi:glycine cleavage system H protein
MTVKYTSDHEWIQLEDHEAAVVGITLHAQDALGDVVFVDLPEVGRSYAKGEVAGEVTEVNEALRSDPSLANTDPMGKGWFFKILIKDMAEFDVLMDRPAYDELVKNA